MAISYRFSALFKATADAAGRAVTGALRISNCELLTMSVINVDQPS
jgi:hypothetical protein